MKAFSKCIRFIAAVSTAAWFSVLIQAQGIDPATGLPAASTPLAGANPDTGLPTFPAASIKTDPKTGLPMGLTPDDIGQHNFPPDAIAESFKLMPRVTELIEDFKYEDALQLLMNNHQHYKLNDPLAGTLLPDWIELSRRFPKAKAALIEIRDQYQNEFYAGRGYQFLFGELSAINSKLRQDDATYALFQFIRQKDKKLAEQCFGNIEPLLIRRGEFDLCMSYVGNPKEKFYSIQKVHERALDNIRRQTEWQRKSDQLRAKTNQRLGLTNNIEAQAAVTDDLAVMQKKSAEDDFVNSTRQLIHILVGAGRTAEAEEIQKQAMAVLEDAGLRSAVSDAERTIHQTGSI